jgi:hypothetical protein
MFYDWDYDSLSFCVVIEEKFVVGVVVSTWSCFLFIIIRL